MTYLNAKAALLARGLTILPAQPVPGTVKSQNALPLIWVPLGSAMGVTMQVKVPNLHGMSYANAKQALAARGLKIGLVPAQIGLGGAPSGTVGLQNHVPGTPIDPGLTVLVKLKAFVPSDVGNTVVAASTDLHKRGLGVQVVGAKPKVSGQSKTGWVWLPFTVKLYAN
jgi:beta-lactam-binding protein with PASTA domain